MEYWICFNPSLGGVLRLRDKGAEKLIVLKDDLSVGDLSDLRDRKKRLLSIYPSFRYYLKDRVLENYRYFKSLNRFSKIGEHDTAIVWYDDCAKQYCGMLRAVHDLYLQGAEIQLIHIESVGVVNPSEIQALYMKRRRIPSCEAKKLSEKWEKLVKENMPLRVSADGGVISAAADYYDSLILKHISEQPVAAIKIIINVLELQQVRIDLELIEERLRVLIASGAVECVQDGASYRELVVRRTK